MVVYNKIATISLVFLVFLTAVTVSPAFADESEVNVVTINISTSCSISATGADSHITTINNGQTINDIGTTNLKALCNDSSGYAIYAIGYTDDTYGKTVLTSSVLNPTSDIIASSTIATDISSWAMKLTAIQGTYTPIITGSNADNLKQSGDPDFSAYQAVPQNYTKVAYFNSSTDLGSEATGSNLATTYRVHISPAQPAGTYVGKVKYTLIHPNSEETPTLYTISFNANSGSDTVTGLPAQQDGLGIGPYIITLPSTAPVREGYDFLGWSLDSTATTADYLAGGTFTATTANPTLYAVWKSVAMYNVIAYNQGSNMFDSFSGDGQYSEGDIVEISCSWASFSPPCAYAEESTLTPFMDNISIRNLATCVTTSSGGKPKPVIDTTTCTYSFIMPARDVTFSHCRTIDPYQNP